MRKRTKSATKIQALIRGFLSRKKTAAKKRKVYSRYTGGRAGYLQSLRSKNSYYSGVYKKKAYRD
jgi:hypothetical protein